MADHPHPAMADRYRVAIERAVTADLGRPWAVAGCEDLGDRASHPCAVLRGDGLDVFVKLDASGPLRAELAGLRLLTERGGVRTPAAIGPGVIELDDGAVLLLEAVRTVPPDRDGWRDIGRTLARLHSVTGPRFGLEEQGWFGPFPQDNRPASDPSWATFYAERRLRPRLEAALASGHLPAMVGARVEALIDRVPALAGPEVAPALLHGDAQRNNLLTTARGTVAIDPAAHFGHPEVDLALFDHFGPDPGIDDVLEGYREVRAIDPGFASRRDLWRVFAHLAVVTVDASYLPALTAALDAYVA